MRLLYEQAFTTKQAPPHPKAFISKLLGDQGLFTVKNPSTVVWKTLSKTSKPPGPLSQIALALTGLF